MNVESYIKRFNSKAELVEYTFIDSNKEILIQHDKELKSFSKSSTEAYSVRMLVKGSFGFASSSTIKDLPKLFMNSYRLALNASKKRKSKTSLNNFNFTKDRVKPLISEDPFLKDDNEKIRFISDVNKEYNSPEIKDIETMIGFTKKKSNYLNSLGADIEQEDYYTGFSSSIVGGRNLEQVSVRKRAKTGFELFKLFNLRDTVKEATEKLMRLITAPSVKCGSYDLVLDPDIGGTFFHEAVGHALEADTLREKCTCLALNERVGPEFLTLLDDPTLIKRWGSYAYDNEGIRSSPSVLIQNGVVVNFINDISTHSDFPNLKKTANARAETPHSLPIPRMSNIVVKKGSMTKDEIIRETKNGLMVTGFAGGAVEPITGIFSFKAPEAFVIKNGEISGSLKGVTLSGDLKKLLSNILYLGSETANSLEGGFCGKKNQQVPVSEDIPYLSVRGVNVGN